MKSDNINQGAMFDSVNPLTKLLIGDLVRSSGGPSCLFGTGYNNHSMPIISLLIRKMLVDTGSGNDKFLAFKNKYQFTTKFKFQGEYGLMEVYCCTQRDLLKLIMNVETGRYDIIMSLIVKAERLLHVINQKHITITPRYRPTIVKAITAVLLVRLGMIIKDAIKLVGAGKSSYNKYMEFVDMVDNEDSSAVNLQKMIEYRHELIDTLISNTNIPVSIFNV